MNYNKEIKAINDRLDKLESKDIVQELECLNTKCKYYRKHCGCSLKKVTLDCNGDCSAKEK